jgi:hypothetical protein
MTCTLPTVSFLLHACGPEMNVHTGDKIIGIVLLQFYSQTQHIPVCLIKSEDGEKSLHLNLYILCFLFQSCSSSTGCKLGWNVKEKNPNLVYEVAADVRFGHELANRDFWVTKLPHTSVLVSPRWPPLVWWRDRFFTNATLELCFFSFENLISVPSSLPKYPQKKYAPKIDPESSNGMEASDLPI